MLIFAEVISASRGKVYILKADLNVQEKFFLLMYSPNLLPGYLAPRMFFIGDVSLFTGTTYYNE